MEGFAKAHAQEAAILRKECIEQAGIDAGSAFIAVEPGEAVVQEQAGSVKIDGDRVFIADVLFLFFIGLTNDVNRIRGG